MVSADRGLLGGANFDQSESRKPKTDQSEKVTWSSPGATPSLPALFLRAPTMMTKLLRTCYPATDVTARQKISGRLRTALNGKTTPESPVGIPRSGIPRVVFGECCDCCIGWITPVTHWDFPVGNPALGVFHSGFSTVADERIFWAFEWTLVTRTFGIHGEPELTGKRGVPGLTGIHGVPGLTGMHGLLGGLSGIYGLFYWEYYTTSLKQQSGSYFIFTFCKAK